MLIEQSIQMHSHLHVDLGTVTSKTCAQCCSKLDILLEWKQVSVSKTLTHSDGESGSSTATRFKMDSKFGPTFHQRFSNLLGNMA